MIGSVTGPNGVHVLELVRPFFCKDTLSAKKACTRHCHFYIRMNLGSVYQHFPNYASV